MNILVKKPLRTILDEEVPQDELIIVFPGEYQLILVQMGKVEMFFFLEEELRGVAISKTILYALEKIGLIEIMDGKKISGLTTNFPPENVMTVANMAGRLGGRPYF